MNMNERGYNVSLVFFNETIKKQSKLFLHFIKLEENLNISFKKQKEILEFDDYIKSNTIKFIGAIFYLYSICWDSPLGKNLREKFNNNFEYPIELVMKYADFKFIETNFSESDLLNLLFSVEKIFKN